MPVVRYRFSKPRSFAVTCAGDLHLPVSPAISPWIVIWRLSAYIDLWAARGGTELCSQPPKSYGLDFLHYGAQSHRERLDVFSLAPVA